MKRHSTMKSFFALLLSVFFCVTGAQAQTLYTNSFSQSVNTIIPDDNPNGLASTIQLSGVQGSILSLNVSLDVTNGFAGDYYAYLADPRGDFSVLLNRVGVDASNPFGYSDTGFNLTFTSLAANNIHFYQQGSYTLNSAGQLTGVWAPDGRDIDPESPPSAFSTASTSQDFNSFLGNSADGPWTLFIADLSGGYEGTLDNWSLTIISTPEPSTTLLMGLAGVVFGVVRYCRRQR